MGDLGFETLQFRDLSVDKTDSSGDDLSDCVVSACYFFPQQSILQSELSLLIENQMAGFIIRDFSVDWDRNL